VESLKEKVQDGLLEVNHEFITQPSNLRQAQVVTLLACHNQPIAIKTTEVQVNQPKKKLCVVGPRLAVISGRRAQ